LQHSLEIPSIRDPPSLSHKSNCGEFATIKPFSFLHSPSRPMTPPANYIPGHHCDPLVRLR
jgi:hypothetical protein